MSEEVLATGRFRVDRRRALEKMEKFQLADPRAYTLELVAAAVSSGASRIDIRNDSDDFELSWEGDGPTRDELDGIFDHLFSKPTTARAGMLQHLAIGVLGALGQAPRWVRIDRGGTPSLRLDIVDPVTTLAVEHPHDVVGTRVHVRQRLSVSTLAEALLLPLRDPSEARLLREAARWCPVPVHIGGKPIVAPVPSPARATWAGHRGPHRGPPGSPQQGGGGGALWLVPDPRMRIDVVRNGVIVGQAERTVGSLGVTGWYGGPLLNLDASRARIVEDEAWKSHGKELDEAVAALLHALALGASADTAGLDVERRDVARAELIDAATWLARQGRPIGGYATLPLLVDLVGRTWSAQELGAFVGKKGTVTDAALVEAGNGCVLFAATARAALDVLCPGLPDLTTLLRTRAEGRDRRGIAAQARRPPEFPASVHQLAFTEGPLRGAVCFREGTGLQDLLVHLRIDGMPVEEIAFPSPAGAMEAILDHPGFATDDGFRHVTPDATRAAAEATLFARARAFATTHVERLARGATLSPPGMMVLTAALRAAGAKAREDLGQLLARRGDDALLRSPAFACGDGRRLSLPEVIAPGPVWLLVAKTPRDCPPTMAGELLLVPEDVLPAWLAWLGPRARDARSTLEDDIRGARRRALPKRRAALDASVSPRVPVATGGYVGELGLDGSARAPSIELLRDGIAVCTVSPPIGLLGLVGVVDNLTLGVNRAHDAPTSVDAAAHLVKALAPAVEALVRAAWDAHEGATVPSTLLAWLTERGEAVPDWASTRPVARTVEGANLTFADLRARASDRRAARIKLLPRAPGDVPGFEDAVVATPVLQKALLTIAPRAVRVGDAELADATRHLAAYLARPRAEEPAALASSEEVDGDVRVRWVLLADPDQVAVMRVEARWRDRVLATRDRGESLGVLGVVQGAGITPSAALTELRNPQRLHPLLKKARTRFDDIVVQALDALGDSEVPEAQRGAWRGVLARLDGANDRTRSETAIRDRLARLRIFRRLDGTLVSRAEVLAALEAGPVWQVPLLTPPGALDSPWYLLAEPWTLRAMGVPASRIGAGGPALLAWREGEERRRSLDRREPVVSGNVLARGPVVADGVVGEVALLRVREGRTSGLEIQTLVDGLPLDPVTVPFPGPAVAVITGPSVVADRAFRTWVGGAQSGDPKADHARATVLAAARTLAATFTAGIGPAGTGKGAIGDLGPLRGLASREELWAVTYALADRGGPGAALPLFPLLGGGTISAAALDARGKDGGIGVVAPGTRAFVAGAPPVEAPKWLYELLAPRFTLVDLAAIASRHLHPAPSPTGQHEFVTADARVGFTTGVDGVEVRREGVHLATLPARGPVPITGRLESPTADVDPLWRGLLPSPATSALEARLLVLSEAVLARMVDDAEAQARRASSVASPLREALVAALDRGTASARDDAMLGAPAAANPLVARLLALPLFRDCAGGAGTLTDVLARSPVRVVAPGVTGMPLPSRGRVWTLDAVERRLVGRLRRLQDVDEALREETRGAARRAVACGPAPSPPKDAHVVTLGRHGEPHPGWSGALWIGGARRLGGAQWLGGSSRGRYEESGPGIAVRVDGATVQVLHAASGVAGWVEGPFQTDASFTTVTLPDDVTIALRGAAAELLQREVASDPARVHGCLSAALAACSHEHEKLLAAPLSPWGLVALLPDTAGKPLDLPSLRSAIKGRKRLLVGAAGAVSPRKNERVVAGGDETLALLRGWFPGVEIEHVDEARIKQEARRRVDAERREKGAVGKQERAFAGRAATLYTKWTGAPAPEKAIDAWVSEWAAGRRAAWPPFAEADPDGPWTALIAFGVGVAGTGPHMPLITGLAAALKARPPR
ncbi:MAG: hypothetical protein Q8P18_14210 [Pseudomonadota bacterium]|nr:hypothetical protein [Pseudomonadota bacterium]